MGGSGESELKSLKPQAQIKWFLSLLFQLFVKVIENDYHFMCAHVCILMHVDMYLQMSYMCMECM